MNPFYPIIWGIAAGFNRASWGAYKDSPYEPFQKRKYFRSIILSISISLIISNFLISRNLLPKNPLITIGIVLGLDTILTEFNKLFIRKENQDKYKIPSAFHFLNLPLTPTQRFISSAILSTFLLFITLLLFTKNTATFPTGNILLNGTLIGLLSGILEAIGGSWKDAPFENFQPLKFFRSPTIGTIWGTLIYSFTPNSAILLYALFGLNRATIEFYKTFIKNMRSGKFKATVPVYKNWVHKRRVFIFPYIISLVIILHQTVFYTQ